MNRPCGCYYGEDCTKTTVCANEAVVEDLKEEVELLRDALRQISYGEGRYNSDQLTHAENTIEDMIALAKEALEGEK